MNLESLLIVCPSWVGDAVMATPVLRAARQSLPGAKIIAAMRRGLDDLLAGSPWLDEVVTIDMKGPLGPRRAAKAIRRHRPHAALLLPNSFRSALTVWLARVPVRIGYDRDVRGRLLTHRLEVEKSDAPTPAIAYYARLGRFALDADDLDPRMELTITDEQNAAADRMLKGIDGPFIVLNPGANRPDKRWPYQRFAQVADALHESDGLRAVATGSPDERKVVEAVVGAAQSPIVNLVDRGVDLGTLKAVIHRAALMITNDTGPRHIAAALGTPLISLFGPTDHRWTTLPDANEQIILAEPFLPEELIADRHPKLCAMDRIPVEDVYAAARGLCGG
jgi:heptosyltransferase-2